MMLLKDRQPIKSLVYSSWSHWLGLTHTRPSVVEARKYHCRNAPVGNSVCSGALSESARAYDCCHYRSTWQWSDGSPMTYMNWKDQEPYGTYYCVMIQRNKQWFAYKCSLERLFICRRRMEMITVTTSMPGVTALSETTTSSPGVPALIATTTSSPGVPAMIETTTSTPGVSSKRATTRFMSGTVYVELNSLGKSLDKEIITHCKSLGRHLVLAVAYLRLGASAG